ncbi:hypothetical protein KQI63_13250 [bacterium]|nr:hypothetical protein [bacterium]
MSARKIKVIFTTVLFAIAILLSVFPTIEVNSSVLIIVVIAILPWLNPIFKSIELPGGFKFEFQQLKEVEKKVIDSGLIETSSNNPKEKRHIYSFEHVTNSDPTGYILGLSIELRSKLQMLAASWDITTDNRHITDLTNDLYEKNILNNNEREAINDIIPVLQKAMHSDHSDNRTFDWVKEFGPKILRSLDNRMGEISIPSLVDQWNSRDGALVAEVGTEMSKAFVNSPSAFFNVLSKDIDAFNSWIDNLDHNTFTIFESNSEEEDDLYLAYYNKLRNLMIDAANKELDTEHKVMADKLIAKLMAIDVRRIW